MAQPTPASSPAPGPVARLALVRGTLLRDPDGTRPGDGDTVRVVDPVAYDSRGRRLAFRFHRLSATTHSLPVRLLGVDTPEETYAGGALPGLGMPNLHLLQAGRVPQQEPWGEQAKVFADQFLSGVATITVELDERVFDRNQRLLGYVYRGDDLAPEAHLNLALLRSGWATLYQVHPNFKHQAPFRAAVELAQRGGFGLWPSLEDRRPLTVDEVEAQTALNPPFVYRKVIDAFVAGVTAEEALRRAGRWVGDVDTFRLYPPERWMDVPHARRAFFERVDDARALGYRPVPRRGRAKGGVG